MINMLIGLLVLCLVAGVVYYIITLLPLPQPFKNIVLVIALLIFLLILLNWLWPLAGFGPVFPAMRR